MPVNEGDRVKWLKRQVADLKKLERLQVKDIAESIGVKPNYLSRAINGHVPVSDSLIEKFQERFHAFSPDESRSFREEQRQYAAGNPAGVAEAIKEHNASLQANLADLRKNIEDLRRENEAISQYIKDLKQQQ